MSVRSTAADVRAGIRVEWLTIAWMTVEALVSIEAGLAARSIALIGFGADSVIELISAGVLLWRLRLEPVGAVATTSRGQSAERQASRVVGWSLLLLAIFYLLIDVWGFRKWAFPFVVIGMNAIALYTAVHIFDFKNIGKKENPYLCYGAQYPRMALRR